MIVMGIGPDKGWAIADHRRPKEDRILGAGSLQGLHEMFALLRELANDPGLYIDEVRIEKPSNKHAYQRPGQTTAAVKSIAANVGENLGKGDAIYYFCKGIGMKAVRTAPIKNGTKLNARQVKRLAGWREKTNEHARVAIIIAWINRNPQPEKFKQARRKRTPQRPDEESGQCLRVDRNPKDIDRLVAAVVAGRSRAIFSIAYCRSNGTILSAKGGSLHNPLQK